MKYLKLGTGIVELDYELSSDMYKVGSTYEEYLDGYWVPLTEQQEQFLQQYPGANAKEIFDMEVVVYVPTLEDEKYRKLHEIRAYDTSSNVNEFFISGEPAWAPKDVRVALMNLLNIEKQVGRTETMFWFNNKQYTVDIDLTVTMLNSLELYASNCYNVTNAHIAAVTNLSTIEEVINYDYTKGYPDKLNFLMGHQDPLAV